MALKTRTPDTLKTMGYDPDIAEVKAGLVEIKAEHFPAMSVDELILTRDDAADFRGHVRKRFGSPRLTRVAILRSLVNVRKAGRKQRV